MGSNFGAFGSLEGVWALPGAPWGPLGGQGAPNMGPGAKSWFVGPPLASQNEVILVSIFDVFLNKKCIDFILNFGVDFRSKMIPK